MPDLNFQVQSVEPVAFSATPQLNFKLRIQEGEPATAIDAIALRCQIRLEPAKRSYGETERAALYELFGHPRQWSQTLRGMLWTHASQIVPAFTGEILAELPVPCTYDFNVAMTKYFDALDEGEVPLVFLFSGTVFYQNEAGLLQAAPIPWEKEAEFRMPAQVWRDMMQRYYPNQAWLCVGKQTLDDLRDYKMRCGVVSWDQAIDQLLHAARQEVAG